MPYRVPVQSHCSLLTAVHVAPLQLPAYVALIKRCWAQNAYDRPDFEEVIHDLRCAPCGNWCGSMLGSLHRGFLLGM